MFDCSTPDLRVVGTYTRFLSIVVPSVQLKSVLVLIILLWLLHAGPSHVPKKIESSTSCKGSRSLFTPAGDDLSTFFSPGLCVSCTEPHPVEQNT